MADKTLPNNVRELREAQLMSKAELARKASLSPLTIDRVESGKPCRMDTKRKIILALGLKLSERHRVFPDDTEEGKRARSRAAREPAGAEAEARGHGGDAAQKGAEDAARAAGSGSGVSASEAGRAPADEAGSAPKDEPQVGSDLPKARYS